MSAPRLTVLSNIMRALRLSARPGGPGMGARLAALPRLAWAVARGHYPGLSRTQLLLMVGALGYILLPVDAMPEAFLGLAGLLDDAVVASWLAVGVVNATEDYLAWERTTTRDGEPVTVRSEVVG